MPEVRGYHHCHEVGVHHLLNIPTQSVVSDSAVVMTRLLCLTVTASGIAMSSRSAGLRIQMQTVTMPVTRPAW